MRAERNEGAGPKKMGVAEYLTCFTTQKTRRCASADFFKDLLRINRMVKFISLAEDTNVSRSGRKGKLFLTMVI